MTRSTWPVGVRTKIPMTGPPFSAMICTIGFPGVGGRTIAVYHPPILYILRFLWVDHSATSWFACVSSGVAQHSVRCRATGGQSRGPRAEARLTRAWFAPGAITYATPVGRTALRYGPHVAKGHDHRRGRQRHQRRNVSLGRQVRDTVGGGGASFVPPWQKGGIFL